MKMVKKMTAVLITVLMLIGCMSMSAFAETEVVVFLGENSVMTSGDSVNFTTCVFTPDEAGYYKFYSANVDCDPKAKVDDSVYDDNIGSDFSFTRELAADETFTFYVSTYDSEDVTVELHIEKFEPVIVTINMQGKGENVVVPVAPGTEFFDAVNSILDTELSYNGYSCIGFSLSPLEDNPANEAYASAMEELSSYIIADDLCVYAIWRMNEDAKVYNPVPTADSDDLQDGDYWFDIVSFVDSMGVPDAMRDDYLAAEVYLSEDGNTLKIAVSDYGEQSFDRSTQPNIFTFLVQHGAVLEKVSVTFDMLDRADDVTIEVVPGMSMMNAIMTAFPSGSLPVADGYGVYGFTPEIWTEYANEDEFDAEYADLMYNTAVPAEDFTCYAAWFEIVSAQAVLAAPKCGTVKTEDLDPDITLPENAHYHIGDHHISIPGMIYTESDPLYWSADDNTVFSAGEQYDGMVILTADYGYLLSTQIAIDGADDIDVPILQSDYPSKTFRVRFSATAVHDYSSPEWTWADDFSSASASFTCPCGNAETVELTDNVPVREILYQDAYTIGYRYTANVTLAGVEYNDSVYRQVEKPQISVSLSGNEVVRGDKLTWTVTTPTDVLWLRFEGNSEEGSSFSQYYKYSNYNKGTTEVTVTDADGVRTWTIPMVFNYAGNRDTDTQDWLVFYKVSGSTDWYIEGNSYNVKVGKNSAAFAPEMQSGAAPYYIISASCSVTEENGVEYNYFTVTATSDVSKIKIAYVNADTGKTKSATYQTTSSNVTGIEDSGYYKVWTIRMKVTAPAEYNTYTVQCRGTSWGEATDVFASF